MELVGFREELERLNTLFPGRIYISVSEYAKMTDSNVKTVYSSTKAAVNPLPSVKLGRKKIMIPIVALARWNCIRK